LAIHQIVQFIPIFNDTGELIQAYEGALERAEAKAEVKVLFFLLQLHREEVVDEKTVAPPPTTRAVNKVI
jgi:hypothetical protein